MPSDDELTAMYDRSYFEDGGAWVCGFWSGSYADNETHLRAEAREALSHLPMRSGRLLEIGCAGGYFLDEARRVGFDVTGCELNHDMVQFGRERLGLTIHEGLFEQQGFPPHSFDVVVAQDVLEHTREPARFIGHAVELLAPGGTLFIRGPLEETTRERIYWALRSAMGRGPVELREPPFHLQGFTRTSFAAIATGAGLTMDRFTAIASPPRWRVASMKDALALPIEHGSHLVDRVRRRGDFMIATAIRSVTATEAQYPAPARDGRAMTGT